MITTARYASHQSRQLAQELACLCGSPISRGKKTIDELVFLSRKKGESRIYIIKENRGTPSFLESIYLTERMEWKWEPTSVEIVYDR